jgi:hypothetical protein
MYGRAADPSMVRGAIVGRSGIALSTFVGTFYAAQMRRSTAPGEPYRFSCSTEALAAVGRLYSALNSGEFPPQIDADELGRVAFSMDFPDAIGKRILPAFGRAKQQRALPELELAVAPLSQVEGKGWVPSSFGWSRLTDCRVLLLVAELPSLDAPGPLAVDPAFASLLSSPGASGSSTCLVWWLPGSPPAPEAKEGEHPQPAIPAASDTRAREALGSALLSRLLPSTAARIGSGRKPASSFFAWVSTERKKGVLRVQRRQLFDVGGVEPEYPYEEALALLDHLRALSA